MHLSTLHLSINDEIAVKIQGFINKIVSSQQNVISDKQFLINESSFPF